MKKEMLKNLMGADCDELGDKFVSNIENFKRRGALQPFGSLDLSSKLFFERALHVKRTADFIFLTKHQGKNR